MENTSYNGLFMWNNSAMGDTLLSIALIDKLLKKYPGLNITLGCWKKLSYLAEHLPINVYGFSPVEGVDNYFFNSFTPHRHFHINTQFGVLPHVGKTFQWKYAIENLNLYFKDSPFNLEYDEPLVELPDLNVDVKPNSVFVENGKSFSGHNDFYYNLDLISKAFPELTFYSTANETTQNPNVISLLDKNSIYLQSVQRKCKAILGKGSGPFILSFNKDCVNTPKALFGFKLEEFKKYWDEDCDISYFAGDDNLVIEYLKKLNIC
jgi:hypothetical protein